MATSKMAKVDGEILTALCHKCKCCLANGSHCWQCHVTMSIQKLCGCDECPAKIDDYKERLAMRSNILNIKRMAKTYAA
jgi:hypothetical protein